MCFDLSSATSRCDIHQPPIRGPICARLWGNTTVVRRPGGGEQTLRAELCGEGAHRGVSGAGVVCDNPELAGL